MTDLRLRAVRESDLPIFFEQHSDAAANPAGAETEEYILTIPGPPHP